MELAFLQSEIRVLSPSIRAKKKQEISLNDFLLGDAADGELVFSFDNFGLGGPKINVFNNLKLPISNQKERFRSPLRNILYLCVLSE